MKSSKFNFVNEHSQNLIRGGSDPSSLVSQIFAASKASNRTFIAKPASSWIDDYISWIENPNCCKYNKTDHGFCPSTVESTALCDQCKINNRQEISDEDFHHYIGWFLKDNPTESCAKGGHAAYGNGVIIDKNGTVGANYFMTYHTILKTSQEYTLAMKEAYNISANITATLRSKNNNVSQTQTCFSFDTTKYQIL